MAKKAQAAMEFLMTYGWAILVVLVVIAALAYFGVLDPTNVLPDKCTFPVTFTCTDYLVSQGAGTVQLSLVNNAGKDIVVGGMSVGSSAITSGCANSSAGTTTFPLTLQQGAEAAFTIGSCSFTSSGKKKDRYTVNVTYAFAGSSFQKTLSGELLTKREQ